MTSLRDIAANKHRIGVVLPAKNEATSLPSLLPKIPREYVSDIVVVDNGSTDNTVRIADALGVRTLFEPRPGYGHAVWTGICSFSNEIDIYVVLDSDGSEDPGYLPQLVAPILSGAHLISASYRNPKTIEKSAMSPHQIMGNQMVIRYVQHLTRHHLKDFGPFRAISKELFNLYTPKEFVYGWNVEMSMHAILHGKPPVEIETSYNKQLSESKISGSFRQSVRAGIHMLRAAYVTNSKFKIGAPDSK